MEEDWERGSDRWMTYCVRIVIVHECPYITKFHNLANLNYEI